MNLATALRSNDGSEHSYSEYSYYSDDAPEDVHGTADIQKGFEDLSAVQAPMQDLPLVPPPMQVPQMAVRGNAFESLDFITEPLPPQIQPLARASHTVSLARISSA